MATADGIKAKMQGLIDSANAKTGGNDTTLTAAVNALIAGFGFGGGTSGIYMAKITPETDAGSLIITHNLGTTDILFAACWAETLGDIVPTFNGAVGKYWAKSDIPRRVTSSYNGENLNTYNYYNITYKNAMGGVPNSDSYSDFIVDNNTFNFKQAGATGAKWIAGVAYTVIIIAANAEV